MEPTTGILIVEEQMILAHRYRNRLCEIELARRAAHDAALLAMAPEVSRLQAEESALVARMDVAITALSEKRSKTRKLKGNDEEKATIKAVRAELKTCRAALKAAKGEARTDPEIVAKLKEIEAEDLATRKLARAQCGLYWGTYCQVEQAAGSMRRGAPPRFMRWMGDGHLCVQLQGGMSMDKLCACTDQRVRLAGTGDPKGRKRVLWMRVGSTDDRDPVWAQIPVLIHREFPSGARLKWLHLTRRKVGTHARWSAVFTLANVPDTRPVAKSGSVSIDFGWRVIPEGLRVASWVGSDGCSGELRLSDRDVSRWTRAYTLRSTRDGNFNVAVDALKAWKEEHKDMPEWLSADTVWMHAWRAAAKLAAVVIRWRDRRFPGDEKIFATLEAWRKQDRHLLEWEVNQMRKSVCWRDDLYHCFARDLALSYRECRIEGTDWRDLAKLPEVEEKDEDNPTARRNRVIASVGRLGEIVRERFGARCSIVEPIMTTQTCAACGKVDRFDAARQVVRTCRHCGVTADQDDRGAKNIATWPLRAAKRDEDAGGRSQAQA